MTVFTLYNAIYLLSQALGVFAVYKLMRAFFEERKVQKAIEVISYVGFYFLTSSVYLIFNIPLLNIIVSISSYFLLTFLYCSSIKKKVLVCLLVYIFGFCTEMVVVALTGYINYPFAERNNYESIFGIVTLNVLLFAVSMIASGFKNIKIGNVMPKAYWAALFVIPVSSLIILATIFLTEGLTAYQIAIPVTVVLIINFTVFFLFDRLAKMNWLTQEKQFIEQQNRYYENQLEIMKASLETSSLLRHDMKNHLLTVSSYIDNGNINELKNHISDIIEVYQSKAEIVNTGYPAIDSLINFKLQSARQSGIVVKINVSIPPDLKLSSYDFTVILGNLIDNAIQAVSSFSEDGYIDFDMHYSKGMLLIKVSNPYKNVIKEEDGKIVTSKKDKNSHGFGLKSVNTVVEKYNGTIAIETSNNIFTITVALYLE